MKDALFPTQLVAWLTGLSAYLIRIWEQRYRAVEPRRTPTQRPLYSQREIERLNLLRGVSHAGHRIGQVAQLPTDKLRKLAAASASIQRRAARSVKKVPAPGSFLDECVAAVKSLDAPALDEALKRGATALGSHGLLHRVVAPLAQILGALALLIGAGFGFVVSVWLGAGLAVAGVFVLFEALRGWCVLRACGIKTRI